MSSQPQTPQKELADRLIHMLECHGNHIDEESLQMLHESILAVFQVGVVNNELTIEQFLLSIAKCLDWIAADVAKELLEILKPVEEQACRAAAEHQLEPFARICEEQARKAAIGAPFEQFQKETRSIAFSRGFMTPQKQIAAELSKMTVEQLRDGERVSVSIKALPSITALQVVKGELYIHTMNDITYKLSPVEGVLYVSHPDDTEGYVVQLDIDGSIMAIRTSDGHRETHNSTTGVQMRNYEFSFKNAAVHEMHQRRHRMIMRLFKESAQAEPNETMEAIQCALTELL